MTTGSYPKGKSEEIVTMVNRANTTPPVPGPVRELTAELARKITSSIGFAQKLITDVPGLTLTRRTHPMAPAAGTYEPSLAVVAQGRKRVDLGRATFIFDTSRFLLTSLDLPIIGQVIEASEREPFLCLMLKLEMPLVRELLGREEIPVPAAAPDSPAMATGDITVELLDACCRLMDLVNSPRHIPFLSGLIQREIIYRILQEPAGARLRAIATLGDRSQRTARAIAWIQANYRKPLRVEELAQVAGMSASTLHNHFRALTAMSPLQYRQRLRLHAARGRMLADGLDAASAAFEVGYESATQFNREYSRFFGQPPMRDVRTLRSPTAPPAGSVQ
jgi:AraC-like DNA-binding protein